MILTRENELLILSFVKQKCLWGASTVGWVDSGCLILWLFSEFVFFARHIRWASKVSKARRGQQVSKLGRGHLVLGTSKVDAVSTSLFWYNHATFIGACLSKPHAIVFYGNTCIDRLTVSVPFTWYWYDTHAHAATPCHAHVRGGEQCGDSYKAKNVDSGKAKSWDTHATNCEAGMRERPVNLFILVLPCQCRHPFTYVSFSRRSLHTNPFSHFPTESATRAHRILGKTFAHLMHTGMHRPHPLA